jgi:serine protease Do
VSRLAARRLALSLLAAAVGLPGGAGAQPAPVGADDAGARPDAVAYDRFQDQIVEISNRVIPSVVHIEAIIKINDRRNQVSGSGVIASPDGLILTNHHVVEKAEKVTVAVPGVKGKAAARILGADAQTDIALLRIEPSAPLPAARFGRTADVRVGQWVLAIGNPYGLDGTVSLGIVSAKGRNLGIPDLLNDFIQTDAMIDVGSSGGPLVDLEGRVIGINSRGQGRGIGFTIPIDTALDVMRQIEAGGVARGWLGVTVQALDRELADYFGAPDETGVIVNSIVPHSPAERAGLRVGDIITDFNGTSVEAEKDEDLGNFQRLVASVAPGQEARLTVRRDGKVKKLAAKLAVAPHVEPDEEESDVGFHVQEITEAIYRGSRLSSRKGAFVSFVAAGSPAAEAGMHRGDVVRRIGESPVDDLADFRKAVEGVAPKTRFLVTAERGEETVFLLLHRGARPAEPRGLDADAGEASQREPRPSPTH